MTEREGSEHAPAGGVDELGRRIQDYYAARFDESERLRTRSAQGELEFRRTLAALTDRVEHGRVLDIGGGTGPYARALLDRGYDVDLLDPVPRHVAAARRSGIRAVVGDARRLPYDDGAADAVLLLGPLYHLASRDDRLLALRESGRVLRPGGVLLAAALSRFVAIGAATLAGATPLDASELDALVRNGVPPSTVNFPAGHYHLPEELEEEVAAAGFGVEAVIGVEGPGGLPLEETVGVRPEVFEAALVLAQSAETVPGVRDLSPHLLAIARRP